MFQDPWRSVSVDEMKIKYVFEVTPRTHIDREHERVIEIEDVKKGEPSPLHGKTVNYNYDDIVVLTKIILEKGLTCHYYHKRWWSTRLPASKVRARL